MAFAIFSIKELIYDKSGEGYFLKKIRNGGWVLILIAFLSIVFNLYKDLKSEHKQVASDRAKEKVDSLLHASQIEIKQLQISTKDSIIKKVDFTYTNSIRASNEALAKYNLKITDSLHSVVSRLKLNALNPQLSVAPLGEGFHPAFLNKDRSKLNIQFVSTNGTCYNILIYCYLIKEIGASGYEILKSQKLYVGEDFMTDDIKSTTNVDLSPVILDNSEILIFLTGSFTKDHQGKIVVPFNGAFRFNIKDNKYISKLDMSFEQLKKDLKIK